MGKYGTRAGAGMAVLRGLYNSGTGVWDTTGWWNSANALETSVDYSIRTGDTSYTDVIENTFTKKKSQNFLNQFYDDEGWWALAWIKAYDFKGDRRYLQMAKTIFSDMCGGWDATCGGGIWWNKAHEKKNAIANELFLSIAARLHLRTPGDGGAGSYLEWAQRSWSWFASSGLINANNLINDGLTAQCVNDGGVTWTYNQGVILGALVALHEASQDQSLLDRAQAIANAALATLTDANGILREPNEPNLGVDGPQFKGIFMRNVYELYNATGEQAYRDAIVTNANAIWSFNRNDANALGGVWAGPFDSADASRQSSALDAMNGAVVFDIAGITYQTEDGALENLSTEAKYAGYHGTGYVAGWNRDGQAVVLTVNVPADGLYDLVLRYAAVSQAIRCIRVNGSIVVQKQLFRRTGSWQSWALSILYDVPLTAGDNAISIAFEQANASQGWLNLDELTVQ